MSYVAPESISQLWEDAPLNSLPLANRIFPWRMDAVVIAAVASERYKFGRYRLGIKSRRFLSK
jgi:hypothetical protein